MILSMLVDFNDKGALFAMTIETKNKKKLFKTLHKYSHDVRLIGQKKERGARDKGERRLSDGSTVLRCKYFGDKIPAMYAFDKSPGKMRIVNMGVVV